MKEEERIEKSRRPALRVVTPVADVQESGSILAYRPIKMDDRGAQGSRRLERRKMQSRGKLITSANNLGVARWDSQEKNNCHLRLGMPQRGAIAN